MRGQNIMWSLTKTSILSAIIFKTISDRYVTIVPVRGTSMFPTLMPLDSSLSGFLKGDRLLCEKFCLEKYKFSRGDIVTFVSPRNHKELLVKRLIALPGDWVQVPSSSDIVKIPDGHCWVEGENVQCSMDSRHFGPIPLGLMKGKATHVIWPPLRISQLDRKMAAERISPH